MERPSAAQPAPPWLVWAALLVIYLVWGSTYLAIALVVESMPPLLSAGGRFLVAGAIMTAVLILRHGPRVLRLSRGEIVGGAFVGLALLMGGNGLVMLGQQSVPSGLAALIIAVVPLWVVVLRLGHGERIARGTLLGVLIGFGGVAVLVAPRGISGTVDLIGMLMLIAAGASWAVGTFASQRLSMPRDPFVSTSVQMLFGGLGLVLVGTLSGDLGYAGQQFTSISLVALLYLIFFGSILAFTAYTWLLQHAPVSKVATYAYVNPVVAITLGAVVLREDVGLSIALGGAMILASVGLVIRTEARPRVAVGALDAPPPPHAVAGAGAGPEDDAEQGPVERAISPNA